MFYLNETVNRICNLERVIIYGAGTMGRALKTCLESEPYNKKVETFLVQDMSDNPSDIYGCPVVEAKTFREKDCEIIVALNEKNLISAEQTLADEGFKNLIILNAAGDSWSYIKGNYFLEQKELYIPFKPLDAGEKLQIYGNATDDFKVYVARSIFDKKTKSLWRSRDYETDIQVGAALTDKKICDIRDDTGSNISNVNKKYCEITALYWIWKNDKTEYVGLSHYRRRFALSDDEIVYIKERSIDVVLTIPIINARGIKKQYEMDHSPDDFDVAIDEVQNIHPEYASAMKYVGEQSFFYAYNMFVMKHCILDQYCEWLFPILFACEKRIGEKSDSYQNRYVGFLAERLLNVFLYYNRDRLKVLVARKTYLY